MGYYKDDHINNRQSKKSKNRWLMPGGLGAAIGASVMLIAAPMINGDINGTLGDKQVEANSEVKTEQVSYNVTTDVTKAVDKVDDAIVSVSNLQQSNFGDVGKVGSGSGVIYKKENGKAFIVTNNHVVEGAAELEVTLKNEEKVKAKLLGTDPLMDLAVLQIDGSNVEATVEFGNSDQLKAGEPAIALGNPLGFLEGSVTQGIISNPKRTIPTDIDQNGQPDWEAEVIQTDASINPGNSGGALINIAGQLIGINSSKIAQTNVEGIGFAIPVNVAAPIIEQLETTGKVERPYLGIRPYSLSEVPEAQRSAALHLPEDVDGGVVIMGTSPGTPAAEAGLQDKDVIVALNGKGIKDAAELRKFLYTDVKVGDKIKVKYYRDGQVKETTLTLSSHQF
ncbi:S1C family serine protease [Pseudalkalibacillus caeni]|uniref:PDZ domain-containing protein n=1 Tax=Exobacillus caeni TaxID=2574798 RepID=A0A5R9F3U9_9BACL|nr:trypsin-like peptidase domain-containing protein [Pseudalkalibacillus caeni]TLS38277.1 PDZ domain-containing protein [Pseudalkalibacillus caeni]